MPNFKQKRQEQDSPHQLKVGDKKFEGETKLPYVVHFPLIRNLHFGEPSLGNAIYTF